MTAPGRSRYGIIPADPPAGVSFPVWVVRDHRTGDLVKALPPRPEPLRFYSYAHAQAWVHKNERPTP
ncbi:hypothetical protein VM98_34990 [Streptomyces rubellomurinus subsp. indigoferus]|nr:hypothetical protein VM98_34990 [Streptomyces rubellomurinus subsp. indigoferus]